MSQAAAALAAQQLRTALLDNGVSRVSIELQPGVGPKADPWGIAPFVRGLGHHIVSRRSQGLTPGLALVKKGRSGASPLQGPLCNGYGGFDLTARIITMGWANHPGAGGPWSVPGWGTVPKDDGRPRIFGWEFEGGLSEADWTDEMHEFMARCAAGTLDWLGTLNGREPAPLACSGEHKDPWAPGRKIDRLGYTAASGRARIAAIRGTGGTTSDLSEEDDMAKYKAFTRATRYGGDGVTYMGAPGQWVPVYSDGHLGWYRAVGLCDAPIEVSPAQFAHLGEIYAKGDPRDALAI